MKEVTLEGINELQKKFKDLIEVIDDKKVETALMKSARKLKDAIKERAPIGLTGNLKRSIVAKRFRKRVRGAPAVFVAVDYRIGPHAHLIEYGHAGPHPAPAHPFFRNTYDAKASDLTKKMETDTWKVIEKAAEKK